MATNQQQIVPGQFYGLPGFDNPTHQEENNSGVSVTLNQANAQSVTGLVPFSDSDVVEGWDMEVTVSPTYTPSTGTITVSPEGPYSYLQTMKLQVQKAYSLLDVPNGLDAMIFHLIHPARKTSSRNALLSAPQTLTAMPSTGIEANLNALTGAFSDTDSSVPFTIPLDAGIELDAYFDLDQNGNVLSAPHRRFVSPQYMASSRNITPSIQFGALLADTNDHGAATGTSPASASGTATINFYRRAIYGSSNLAVLPPVANWQLQRQAEQVAIGAQSSVKIPLTNINGQILCVYVRLFDPNGGVGAPIPIANLSECDLVFGSGLFRYQDTPRSMQRRIFEQHNTLLPKGVVAWDLLTDKSGRRVNGDNILNTYTTGGVYINLKFGTVPSSEAYAVVGVEYLTFVQAGV